VSAEATFSTLTLQVGLFLAGVYVAHTVAVPGALEVVSTVYALPDTTAVREWVERGDALASLAAPALLLLLHASQPVRRRLF